MSHIFEEEIEKNTNYLPESENDSFGSDSYESTDESDGYNETEYAEGTSYSLNSTTSIMEIKDVYDQEGRKITLWIACASFVLFLLLFSPTYLLFVPLLYLPKCFDMGIKPFVRFLSWSKNSCTCTACHGGLFGDKNDDHNLDQGKNSPCDRFTRNIRNTFLSFVKKI